MTPLSKMIARILSVSQAILEILEISEIPDFHRFLLVFKKLFDNRCMPAKIVHKPTIILA